MFEKQVLNKGFVRLLNISSAVRRQDACRAGIDDTLIVDVENTFDAIDTDPALVAKGSFGKAFQERAKELDEGLCEYLIRNEHTTPLEFTTIVLEFKMPIFVARQVVRHRTGQPFENNTGNEPTVNEVSGRYVILPDDWYIPEVVRGKHSGGNKQGSEDNLSLEVQDWFKEDLEQTCCVDYKAYSTALEKGVCPEQARMFLHLNHYTQFIWKQDLHNLMHFLSLRLDEHAQWETRQYAEAIYALLKEHLPKSMVWFDEYRRKLDESEKALLKTMATWAGCTSKEQALLTQLAKRNGVKL